MGKPRRVIAKITRTTTEIAKVILDKDGNIEEYEECFEELDMEDIELLSIRTVLSEHED